MLLGVVVADEQTTPKIQVPDNATEKLDIVYAKYGEVELKLDLCIPKGEGPFPGLLIIHGGGWTRGKKIWFRSHMRAFAAKGYLTAAIDYRKPPEAIFPAPLDDCKAAVRWLRANAKTYKMTDKVGVVGGSAGAHLASVLSTSNNVKGLEGSGDNMTFSSAVQVSVNWAGPVNTYDRFANVTNKKKYPKNWLQFFGGATAQDKPALYKLASAEEHINKDTPPQFLVSSEFDAPVNRYKTYILKLGKYKIPYEYINIKGGKHACWWYEPWFYEYIDKTDKFISKYLK